MLKQQAVTKAKTQAIQRVQEVTKAIASEVSQKLSQSQKLEPVTKAKAYEAVTKADPVTKEKACKVVTKTRPVTKALQLLQKLTQSQKHKI